MLYAKVNSAALAGMDSFPVQVETDLSDGLPHVEMVGTLSTEAREARERVRTALKNSGIRIPPKKITVSLSPADRRKEGSGFDLAMAAGIAAAMGMISDRVLRDCMIVGEVCLDGRVRGVRGVLAIAGCARREGIRRLFVPRENAGEGAVFADLEVMGVGSVKELLSILRGENAGVPEPGCVWSESLPESGEDFSQVGGQEAVKRAAEVACAGMHNMLMIGSAGAGKSMIARRIPTILPRLTRQESIEISTIYSIGGCLTEGGGLIRSRPFRSPHHTITAAGLAGGGRIPRPGEISFAHGGVLFLDELPEFRASVLETLRQPMEERRLTIVRAGVAYEFPADFMLVAAMNPCRCGYYPDRSLCRCTEREVRDYLGKLSRPLMDRIDICSEVGKVSYDCLRERGESSADIRARVERAAAIQSRRFAGTSIRFNSRIPAGQLYRYCNVSAEAETLLQKVYDRRTVTARGLHSLIRVARTIADLDESSAVEKRHVSEAVFYRGPREIFRGGEENV